MIVLSKDEEANLPHLLASLEGLDRELFVVDSGGTDRTVVIAKAAGTVVVFHPFVNHAKSFSWALENFSFSAPWTMRSDAEERLTPELVQEIDAVLSDPNRPEVGFMLRKRTVFMGRWLRFGGQYPSWHLRLFRTGLGRCEDRLYDQHFVVDGPVGRLRHDYVDVLTDDLGKWTERHNRWATLEARELASGEGTGEVSPRLSGNPIQRKRFLRSRVYRRFPLFVRPFLLFMFDYVLRLGFLDGRPGLIFHVLQRFWFRFLVDAKLYELQFKRCAPAE